MIAIAVVAVLLQAAIPPDSGEVHLHNIRQLTFGGQNAEAYFSQSGTMLIFQRTGPTEQCDQMYTIAVDGTGLQRVSDGRGRTTCGYFYDHDRHIFYSSTEAADSACPPRPDYSKGYVWALSPYDVYTARSDGSDKRRLTLNNVYTAEGTRSPDGKRMVFTSLKDGDLDIYTMNLDGTDVRRLTNTLGYDGGPYYSPDGKMIVYRAFHPSTPADSAEYRELLAQHLVKPTRMDIWVMNVDGSNQHMVVHVPGGPSFAPFFFPDGKRIIFAANPGFETKQSLNFDLFVVNLDGTGLEQITTSPGFDAFPMFSPDGKQLVWVSGRGRKAEHESNVFLADWVEHP
jgi:Tol biopolymer transport system component